MNLKKLELFGFKSFMRKLDIHFSDGITVIVGPNGCGKTNVTDAVRWVLGESNARTLRGTKMDDLIFNGTADYKPLNVAEVELTIDNSSGVLPVDYTEVTVTRRVYRDGEPEFLINKVPGRLRDIHELFMDTGLGSRAYSVIERDMVEMVLADQPEKRRELIEEAAGIHKYKIRERQARRKLESTDEDLYRISDVLREVERQVRSLKRQVGAARRFQEIRDRQRELEIALAMVDLGAMDRDAEKGRETLAEHRAERDGASARVASLESEIETHRAESAHAEHRLAEEQRDVDRLADEARQAESENLVRRERREALRETARRLAHEKEELEARLREGVVLAERLTVERAERESGLAELEEKLREEQESLDRLDSGLETRRQELTRSREAVEEAAQDVSRLRTELASLDARAAHLAERDAALDEDARRLERSAATRRGELEEAERRVAELREGAAAAEEELRGAVTAREELEVRRDAARGEEAALGVEAESARSALEMLRGLQQTWEGYGQGARALLQRGGGFRPLADSVRPTRPDLLPALDAALEGVIELVVAPSSSAAVDAVRSLRTEGGRATVVDMAGFRDAVSSRGKYALPTDAAVIGTARSFLEVDGELSIVLDDLLSRTVIVETLEDALRLARGTEARGFRFVSRHGDWVEHPGIVHGGAPRGTDEPGRLLGRAGRIEELAARVSEADGRRQVARERAEALSAERSTLTERIERARERVDEARGHAGLEERSVERLRAELAAAEARRDAVAAERHDLAGQEEALAREKRGRIAAVEETEERRRRLEEGWKRRESEIVDSSAARDRAQTSCHELRLEAQRVRGELEKTGLELRRIEEARRADEEGITRRDEDLARNDRAVGELDRELEAGEAEAARRAETLDERRRVRDRVAADRTGVLERLREVEQERTRWQRLRDQSAELVHEQEMALQRIESSRGEMLTRVEREFEVNLALPGAREAHGALADADEESLDAARRELEEVRRRVDRLGAVNLVALEQYERESKRYDFLKSQKDDLEEAREKLRRTIRKINRTARTLFMQTLADVQKNFQHTYGTLFDGGHADIRLAGDEDPLHAPIEIFARPRGKKLSNISLLSSGERALTAVAFLFAIYLVKPSPFCILDEVDAPLDDANIGRFLEMLKQVARETQIVMITHNKKTMEVADYLYGVTMQEAGISQLVSVRLGRRGSEDDGGLVEALEGENGTAASREEELVTEGSA